MNGKIFVFKVFDSLDDESDIYIPSIFLFLVTSVNVLTGDVSALSNHNVLGNRKKLSLGNPFLNHLKEFSNVNWRQRGILIDDIIYVKVILK